MRHTTRRRAAVLLALALLLAAGCSSGPQFATVRGVLKVNGKPAAKVALMFNPDAAKGSQGPSSTGETDDEGRFTLTYSTKDKSGNGAVVGWHKVVLSDLKLAESETGRGVPIRFGPEYGAVLSTPLSFEVKPGDQTAELDVPPK